MCAAPVDDYCGGPDRPGARGAPARKAPPAVVPLGGTSGPAGSGQAKAARDFRHVLRHHDDCQIRTDSLNREEEYYTPHVPASPLPHTMSFQKGGPELAREEESSIMHDGRKLLIHTRDNSTEQNDELCINTIR